MILVRDRISQAFLGEGEAIGEGNGNCFLEKIKLRLVDRMSQVESGLIRPLELWVSVWAASLSLWDLLPWCWILMTLQM